MDKLCRKSHITHWVSRPVAHVTMFVTYRAETCYVETLTRGNVQRGKVISTSTVIDRPGLQSLHRLEVRQRQTKRARTEENVKLLDELIISQEDQLQVYHLIHHIVQFTVVLIIFHCV